MDKELDKELNKRLGNIYQEEGETQEQFVRRAKAMAQVIIDQHNEKKEAEEKAKKSRRKNWRWFFFILLLGAGFFGYEPAKEYYEEVQQERIEQDRIEQERIRKRNERLRKEREERERIRIEKHNKGILEEIGKIESQLEYLSNYAMPFANIEDLDAELDKLGDDLDAWIWFYYKTVRPDVIGAPRSDKDKWQIVFDTDEYGNLNPEFLALSTIITGEIGPNTLGVSYSSHWTSGPRVGQRANGVQIGINRDKWFKSDKYKRFWTIFHELGHAVYDWDHNEDSFIMQPYITSGGEYWYNYNKNATIPGLQEYMDNLSNEYLDATKINLINDIKVLKSKLL